MADSELMLSGTAVMPPLCTVCVLIVYRQIHILMAKIHTSNMKMVRKARICWFKGPENKTSKITTKTSLYPLYSPFSSTEGCTF